MGDKQTLTDRVIRYVQQTNNIGEPKSENDRLELEQVKSEDNLSKILPLNLSEVRKVVEKIKSSEVKSSLAYFKGVADELGIMVIDPEGKRDTGEVEVASYSNDLKEEGIGDNEDEVPSADEEESDGTEVEDIEEDPENDVTDEVDTDEMDPDSQIDRISRDVNVTLDKATLDALENILLLIKEHNINIKDDTISKLEGIVNKEYVEDRHNWSGAGSRLEGSFGKYVYGYDIEGCEQKLKLKKALLLMGVPGIGKTMIMKSMLYNLTGGNEERYEIISFGQNTDYSDFIGGVSIVSGKWAYKDGTLTDICKRADGDRGREYYLGIDELSRGNTEAIFGELMTGIEHRDTPIKLGNGRTLVVPSNLYIVGTMNILDNSTKKLDVATLERFTKYIIKPKWSNGYINWLCENKQVEDGAERILKEISNTMIKINRAIEKDSLLGEDKVIGTRSISGVDLTLDNIKIAVENQLIPDIEQRIKNCEDGRELKDLIDEIRKQLMYDE